MQRLCRHPCRTLTRLNLPRLQRQQWRRSRTVSAVEGLIPPTVLEMRRAAHGGGVTPASAMFGGVTDQADPSQTGMGLGAAASCNRALLCLAQADTFSQSRIKNYLQRVGASVDTPSPTHGGTSSSRCSSVETPPRRLDESERSEYAALIGCPSAEKAWISSFDLPVDVLINATIRRQTIRVTGLAMEAKLAVMASCMHAERCLDALNIPLFTSERRQHQRVLQARAEGRTAPEATAEPLELSSVQLPSGVFLPAATAAEVIRAAGKAQPFQQSLVSSPMGRGAEGLSSTAFHMSTQGRGASPGTRRHRRPARRWDAIKPRYGAEWFVRVALEELATLQSTIFAHNRPVDDDDDDDDDGSGMGAMETVTISENEVQILQPEVLSIYSDRSSAGAAAAATGSSPCDPGSREGCAAHSLAYEQRLVTAESKSAHVMIDETEGGTFDLVEDELEKWWQEREVPGSSCLRDPGAVLRVSRYLEGVTGHSFDSIVQTRAAEEDTNVWQQRPTKVSVKLKTWYVMWLDLPGIPVPATGKAVTPEGARDLCAMHAELLLQWFGIHVYDTPREQAMYYDACLRWGRLFAPEPIDPSTVDVRAVCLPRPLKEWYRSLSKLRARRSERNVVEKLLHLNRVVVHMIRQHLVEVNIIGNPDYAELLSLARPCLRSFMVAMRHPFENAIFCYVYTKDKQYRSTVYLPLPERYGVRGGYCIAATPEASMILCALHAIDVLCALDVVPLTCMEQPRWQRMMEVRESLGLILPTSYQYKKRLEDALSAEDEAAFGPPPAPPHPRLRSPPAYRDVPTLAISRIPPYKEVWRIMLTDADVFDVAPNLHSLNDEATRLRVPSWFDFAQTLFEEFAQHAFGWRIGEQRHSSFLLHYAGPQHYRGAGRPTANNFWMELPLDPAVYGRRVALGRCFSRRGAERMMYIHALRIARTLRVTPWDKLPLSKLANELYRNDTARATLRLQQWKWLCSVLLECDHIDSVRSGSQKDSVPIPDAEIMCEFVKPTDAAPAAALSGAASPLGADSGNGSRSPATDLRLVLSPHPVMSRELAVRTLV